VREPLDNLALSNTVRPGVIGWAKTLAREVGPDGITVNSIAPGKIDTERLAEGFANRSRADEMATIPLRRFGRPKEVAEVICFLASDRASYVSGTVIPVDGGMSRSLL
jgi:3-oxoacyl-[acyl-carrier protein] reductase